MVHLHLLVWLKNIRFNMNVPWEDPALAFDIGNLQPEDRSFPLNKEATSLVETDGKHVIHLHHPEEDFAKKFKRLYFHRSFRVDMSNGFPVS